MVKKFAKRNSQLFLILFVGLIAASFMFTGYENLGGTPDVVATVGGLPVKINEYENAYKRQISLYRNFTNNKDLTAQQIKQFRVKENVINNLIEHRLWVKLARNHNLGVSKDEIVDKIKEQSWFLTDKKFDFEKYKYLLRANGMTTAYYETLTGQDTLNALSRQIFSHFPVSKAYMEQLNNFKNQKISAHVVEIQNKPLRKHLKVTRNEVKSFLQKPANLQKAEELFKKRKSDKKSKFDDQKYTLAKELIQNSPAKDKALEALVERLVKKFKTLLKADKMKTAESLKKKYGFKLDKNISMDRFNGTKGAIKISEKNIQTIFKEGLAKRRNHLFKSGDTSVLVWAYPHKAPKTKKEDPKSVSEKLKNEQKTAQRSFQRKLSRSIIDKLKTDISIKVYNNTL